MTNKKNQKTVAVTAPKKADWVNLFKTSYFYWRHWIKNDLKGKVKARFAKDEIGYSGHIAVQKPDVDKAKKILAEYKTKNPDVKDLWWS